MVQVSRIYLKTWVFYFYLVDFLPKDVRVQQPQVDMSEQRREECNC